MYSAAFGGRAGRSKGKKPKKKGKKGACPLCGKKGHLPKDCPTPPPAPDNHAKGAGSGIAHKTSRKASAKLKKKQEQTKLRTTTPLVLPLGFYAATTPTAATPTPTTTTPPYLLFDTGSNIGDTLDTLAASTTTKTKGKKKKNKTVTTSGPATIYNQALFHPTSSPCNYGGNISCQYLKAGRPIKIKDNTLLFNIVQADPLSSFVLGLSPTYDMVPLVDSDDSDEEAVNDTEEIEYLMQEGCTALSESIDALNGNESPYNVVGVCARLDYTPSIVATRPGMSHLSQQRRLRAACRCALAKNMPVQIQVLPGPDERGQEEEADDEGSSNGGVGADVHVVKDLVSLLLDISAPGTSTPPLHIHLSKWCGKCDHVMKLLQAFPTTLYVGLDASVGYAKASRHKKECAFDIPLDRLVLDTGLAIPSTVNECLGDKAFNHGSLVPFVAGAIAAQKPKHVTAVDVAVAAGQNAVALYGQGLVERAEQWWTDNAKEVVLPVVENEQDTAMDAAESVGVGGGGDIVDTEQKKKKPKKKKKGKKNKHKEEERRAKQVEHSVGTTTSEMLEDGFDDLSFFAEDAPPPAPQTDAV